MKRINSIVLLSAGILLSLTGCQKGAEGGVGGKFVEFGAVSGAPSTRTSYSGVTDGNWERIDWSEGDHVLIWSDHAVNRNGGAASAVYDLYNITPSGRESKANVTRNGEDGLRFLEEESTYQFWGMYPHNAYKTLPTDGNVSFDIAAEQQPTDMNAAVMLAYASIPSEQHVDLRFHPAYSAFSFEVAAEQAMQITGFRMKSVKRKNGETTFGPSVLNGTVAAKEENGAWTYTVPAVSETNTVISVPFTTPLNLTMEEGATTTGKVTFMLFAMPVDITSVVMEFDTVVGEKAETRKLTVSYAKDGTTADGTTYAKGDPITFKALKKHNIKGIVLPKSVNHDILLDFQVMPWVDEDGEVTYGPDAIANAVALEFASGAAITSGGSRRQNNNFANATDPIHAYFSVFAPANGTWKITATGATDKILLAPWDDDTATPSTELTGETGERVDFLIVRKEGATVGDSDAIQINFSVTTAAGQEININSEVTRGSALTITGKIGQ